MEDYKGQMEDARLHMMLRLIRRKRTRVAFLAFAIDTSYSTSLGNHQATYTPPWPSFKMLHLFI